MQNSPLNKGHQLERRAEALLKQKKFEECIDCHKNAVSYLRDAIRLTDNSLSRQSIELQIEHQLKQIQCVKVKKMQIDEHRRRQEMLKRANFNAIREDGEKLQHEIYRTIETHDSLVEFLVKRGSEGTSGRFGGSEEEKVAGRVREVDDSTVIEELGGLSEKLRELVVILLAQVEDKDNEIAKLKAHICKLESEKKDEDKDQSSSALKVITDSSGGTSPYVFSPCSELSPDVHDIRGLPELAPLEMPSFDFASLMRNTTDLNLNSVSDKKD